MSKQIKTRRVAQRSPAGIGPRELWLATLGAASLARKQGLQLARTAVERRDAVVHQAIGMAQCLVTDATERVRNARRVAERAVAPVRERAEAVATILADDLQLRVSPLLARLGLAAKPAAKTRRKAVAKVRKPAARGTAAKAKAAPARRRATRKAA